MSNTPRTDEEVLPPIGNNRAVVWADFARNLERELIAAQWLLSKVNTKSWDDLKADNQSLRDQLTRLTADHATVTKQFGEWKEMALRLDAKVIDEQRDHVKTCGYHDQTKEALASKQRQHIASAKYFLESTQSLEARATKAEAALAEALEAFKRIAKIRWGWDGDCGAKSIAENAIDDVEEAIRAARLNPAPDAKGKEQ